MSQQFKDSLSNIVSTVRTASALAAHDVNFYRSMDSDIGNQLDQSAEKILQLTELLINANNEPVDLKFGKEFVTDNWNQFSNILDNLFEQADIAIDDYTKKFSNQKQNASTSQLTYLSTNEKISNKFKKIEKPQLKFRVPIDNAEKTPYKPKINSKPNALIPFERATELIVSENGLSFYSNPYEHEINTQPYPDRILEIAEPQVPKPWDTTTAIWIDNETLLNEMIKDLKKSSEIAIDLEHHDYRTYYGLTSLMQISTRDQDYIIDTLALRDDLTPLNEVFTDPKIVKVFHGAFMDIIWLQRDLGLYVVGLFDTYHASKSLGLGKYSLAFLLEKFAGFITDKKYQLADWRIRPLPKEMCEYARSDTHFLLYIFDKLKNLLLEQDKMSQVLYDSRQVAIKRFEYTKYKPDDTANVVSPVNDKEPWRQIMNSYNIPLPKLNLLNVLYNWRDGLARELDESTRFVMSNQLLVSLVMRSPVDAIGVLSCGGVGDLVRLNAPYLAGLIKDVVENESVEDSAWMDKMYDQDQSERETVDLNEVNVIVDCFNTLISINEPTKLLKKSAFFDDSELSGTVRSVKYTEDGEIKYNISDFKARQLMVESKLSKVTQISFVSPSPIDTSDKIEGFKKIQPKENKDEIITIRKKPIHTPKLQKSPIVEDSPFDYKTAKNIIQAKPENTRRDKKEKNKKRAFDPYNQENDAIKSAKRVNRVVSGKSSSFVNKRKR